MGDSVSMSARYQSQLGHQDNTSRFACRCNDKLLHWQPLFAVLGSCLCYLSIGLLNGYYKLSDYFYAYFVYHNASSFTAPPHLHWLTLRFLGNALCVSFYLAQILAVLLSTFLISPRLGLLKTQLLSACIIVVSFGTSYSYCSSSPFVCVVTAGIVPGFAIGLTSLLPFTYLLQASFFLSQQIFNITSYNISQSAIPRLYAGKIGFLSCLMFTCFGFGLFLYAQSIVSFINPHSIAVPPSPDTRSNELHSVMRALQTTFLITGGLVFVMLVTADLLIYLSSTSPHSEQRDPHHDENGGAHNPKQKQFASTPHSIEHEHRTATPTITKLLQETPYDIQSPLRRQQIDRIQHKFDSLKSPKLTYLKYLLDAGNNIHDLIPTPVGSPLHHARTRSLARNKNIAQSAKIPRKQRAKKHAPRSRQIYCSAPLQNIDDEFDLDLEVDDSDEEHAVQHHLVNNLMINEHVFGPELLSEHESEAMMQKSMSSARMDVAGNARMLHSTINELNGSDEDEGDDTLQSMLQEEEKNVNLAKTVSLLSSRKQQSKYGQTLLVSGGTAYTRPHFGSTRTRTLSAVNTPRIGINSADFGGSTLSAVSDLNVSRLYRRLTTNYDSKFMLQTWKFWHLWWMQCFSSLVLLFVVIEWKAFGVDYLDIDDHTFLLIVFVFSAVFAVFGHLLYGWLFDSYVKHKRVYLALNLVTKRIDILRDARYWRDLEMVIAYCSHLVLTLVFAALFVYLRYFRFTADECVYLVASMLIFACIGCDVILIPIIILDDFGYQYAHQNVSLLYTAVLPATLVLTNLVFKAVDFVDCILLCALLSLLSFILCLLFAKLNSHYLANNASGGNLLSLVMTATNSCCCGKWTCCCLCLCHRTNRADTGTKFVYQGIDTVTSSMRIVDT